MLKVLVLTAVTGLERGKRHTLEGRSNSVGSAASSDLMLYDRQIEPQHAEIKQTFDRWFIVPIALGGISLNGAIITGQSRLNPGDKLTLGPVTYNVAVEELVEHAVGDNLGTLDSASIPRLGDYFVRRGIMSGDQVRRALQRQSELKRMGRPDHFGQIAYDLGFISRPQLERALAEQRSDFNSSFHD